jgi:hypothetical protein
VRAAPGTGVAARAAWQDGFAAHVPGGDRAEGWGGEGGEYARVRRDRLQDAFAAGQTGADELPCVALVDLRAGRQTDSRRLPHTTCSTLSGSAAVS